MKLIKSCLLATATGFASVLNADVLLVGELPAQGGQAARVFQLDGNSREDVIGGVLRVGDAEFTITDVSAENIVGAERELDGFREYAMFSSSYSRVMTRVKPWVAATEYIECDGKYNSFLAVYRVSDQQQAALGAAPFEALPNKPDASVQSVVYCFVSAPEGR